MAEKKSSGPERGKSRRHGDYQVHDAAVAKYQAEHGPGARGRWTASWRRSTKVRS